MIKSPSLKTKLVQQGALLFLMSCALASCHPAETNPGGLNVSRHLFDDGSVAIIKNENTQGSNRHINNEEDQLFFEDDFDHSVAMIVILNEKTAKFKTTIMHAGNSARLIRYQVLMILIGQIVAKIITA